MQELTSVQDFIKFTQKHLEDLVNGTPGMNPMFVLFIKTKNDGYKIYPVEDIPLQFFQNDFGINFIRNELLKNYIDAIKNEGDDVECVLFTFEATAQNKNGLEKSSKEVLVISIETKGQKGQKLITYDVIRGDDDNVTISNPVEHDNIIDAGPFINLIN